MRLCSHTNGVCDESGEYREAVYDTRGIFVAYVCDRCREEKLSGYRQDIFTDPNYWHTEPL